MLTFKVVFCRLKLDSFRLEGTLKTLNDEVGGIVSTEGEVTSASTTADNSRDPGNQQAVWRENGYWNYEPPPDNLKCAKHATGYDDD